jgi:nitrogen regulatory protein P-II 1
MSVAEVKGFGVQKGFTRGEDVKPGEYRFHPKMKVEMVVLEKDVERIIAAITDSLKSNQIGEGKIFVLPIDDAVRTRTGERGRDAIT